VVGREWSGELSGYAAVILAGGAGRRLGGAEKPALMVGGRSLLDRVLSAVAGASTRVVVGPSTLRLPAGVRRVQEHPPGGGPVAAIAAALPLVTEATVALLAADLPFLTPGAVAGLLAELPAGEASRPSKTGEPPVDTSTVDGVVFVDDQGRRQTLCGVWRVGPLRRRLAELDRPVAGAALRDLVRGMRIREVSAPAGGPPPWYDCDEPEDLRRAEGWS
jgi:molybdopterin-guanine dinucleotide biosynthesis protein A